jgi:DNA-binding beta-propeller fold protein YncE
MMLDRLFAQRIPGPGSPPASAPILTAARPLFTPLPANPFAVAVSPDGTRAFVSTPRPGARGLLALAADSPWRLERELWFESGIVPRGIVINRAGRYLIVANSDGGLVVVDVGRWLADAGEPVAAIVPSPRTGSMQVALDTDERFAFVTDEDSSTLSVFDFDRSLATDAPVARVVGHVPLPQAPVGIATTADGAHLLVTSQGSGGRRGSGVLSVLRTEQVLGDPSRAPVRSVPAGSTPVRVALSPSQEVAWVTARGSNSLLAFDLAGLISGSGRALRAAVRVGATPVGVALLDGGATVVVANSNRYGSDAQDPQTLSVVDAGAALAGRPALVGALPAGAFPRELARLPDDRTVLVTNVYSSELEAVSLPPGAP